MIQIIKGKYGLLENGVVKAITKDSPPISLTEEREAELIALGVAVKVDVPKAYTDMTSAELREVAAAKGVDVSAAKSKKKIIALLEAAEAEAEAETEAET